MELKVWMKDVAAWVEREGSFHVVQERKAGDVYVCCEGNTMRSIISAKGVHREEHRKEAGAGQCARIKNDMMERTKKQRNSCFLGSLSCSSELRKNHVLGKHYNKQTYINSLKLVVLKYSCNFVRNWVFTNLKFCN